MRIAIFGYAHPFGEGHVYGAERTIWYLIQELKEMGHECVVFTIKGCTLPGFEYVKMPISWRDDVDIYHEAVKAYEVEKGVKFDYIHSYMASGNVSKEMRDNWPFSIEPYFGFPRINDNKIVYSKKLKWQGGGHGTLIYFGIPEQVYPDWNEDHKDYLVWIGRMDMGKAPDIAIDVAKRAGMRLILMGPAYHYPYSHDHILPLVDGDQVIWLRGCEDEVKRRVFMGAKAFINPLWTEYHEMFGIVNIESMACGVPIIGWNNAECPSAMGYDGGEVIEHGKQGFIINHDGYSDNQRERTITEAVAYIDRIDEISRADCRALYESRFTSKIMAEKHVRYFEIVKERGTVNDVTEEL